MTAANPPYVVKLDRRYDLLGVYDAGTNLTTWTLPFEDPNVDTIVLGEDFGAAAGLFVTPTSVSGLSVTLMGTFTLGRCILGHRYDMSVELTRPFARDQNGIADLDSWLQLRRTTFVHSRSGAYQIRLKYPGRTDRTHDFVSSDVDGETFGKVAENTRGQCGKTRIFVGSGSPRPCTIAGIQYECDYVPRR